MMQEIYQPSNRVFLIRILNSFPTFMFIQFISNTNSCNYILGSQGLVSKVVSTCISKCMIYVAHLLYVLSVILVSGWMVFVSLQLVQEFRSKTLFMDFHKM